MGYLAIIRNIRNIEQNLPKTGSDEVINSLRNQITDKDKITKSLVLPFQIQQAYEIATNRFIKDALSIAMELSLANVPVFP